MIYDESPDKVLNIIDSAIKLNSTNKELFVFDYDNTLAEKGRPLSSQMEDVLADLLLSGRFVAILTARNRKWLEENKIDRSTYNNIGSGVSLKDFNFSKILLLSPPLTRG